MKVKATDKDGKEYVLKPSDKPVEMPVDEWAEKYRHLKITAESSYGREDNGLVALWSMD